MEKENLDESNKKLPTQHFFIFQNDEYPFDFEKFKQNSNYMSRIQEPNNTTQERFDLVNQYDEFTDFSKDVVISFINFCQDQEIEINSQNVIPLYYLSKKYEVDTLLERAEKCISSNYDELILNFLSSYQKHSEEFNRKYEEIIAKHLTNYINNKGLLALPFASLYRILIFYFSRNSHPNDIEKHRIKILFSEIVKKYGPKVSILLSNLNLGQNYSEYMVQILNDYPFQDDFYFYNSSYLKAVFDVQARLINENQMIREEMRKMKEEMISMRENYENQISLQQQNIQSFEKAVKITTDSFNQLDGESQRNTILKMISTDNIQKLSKIDGFISFLLTENQKSNHPIQKSNFIFIPTDPSDDGIFDLKEGTNKIGIESNIVEMLYENKSLGSTKFRNEIANFDQFTFEIKYPSKNFKQLIDIISDVKQSNNKTQFNIIVSIGDSKIESFQQSDSIDTIHILSSVKLIRNEAFKESLSLKRIFIPTSVTSIGKSAFYKCSQLKQVSIPSSISSINDYLFCKCSSLTEVSLPPSITKIGMYSFSECSSLSKIKIPSSVIEIEKYAFSECNSLKEVSISTSLKKIDENVFSGCSSLEEITIPSSVILINDYAFSRCSKLNKVEISSSVKEIGSHAFFICSSLTQIKMPASLKIIQDDAFKGCSSLAQISIPSSLTSIGKGAFPDRVKIIKY